LLTAAGAHDRSSFISLSLRYLSVQRAWSLATTSLRRRWQDSTNLRESANNLKRSGRKLSAILIGAPNVPRNRSPHRRLFNERKRRYLCVAHDDGGRSKCLRLFCFTRELCRSSATSCGSHCLRARARARPSEISRRCATRTAYRESHRSSSSTMRLHRSRCSRGPKDSARARGFASSVIRRMSSSLQIFSAATSGETALLSTAARPWTWTLGSRSAAPLSTRFGGSSPQI